jgi:hypothetical protein
MDRNQLADGSTKPAEDSFGDFLANVPDVSYDVSSIFPGAGTYAVTTLAGYGYYDEDRVPKSTRIELRIDKVEDDASSKLVGRSFSIFFGLQTTGTDDAAAPITFTDRRLHYLMNGEYPQGKASSRIVKGWLAEMVKTNLGFIVERTIKRDKKNVLRANDKLISFSSFKALHGDTTVPEESPEVAADAGSL